MTTKPDLLKWVPDNDPAKIDPPGTTKAADGFNYREKVPFDFLNWLFNKIDKWFLGLQGNYYDIIIGSATQVANNEATHEIDDLDDALAVAGSRVLILDGTHTLTGNLALSNADLKITSESPLAILDVSTFTATFSGARNYIHLRVTNSGTDDIIISGAASFFEGIDVPIDNVAVSNGATAMTSGTRNGQYTGESQSLAIREYTNVSTGVIVSNVSLVSKLTLDVDSVVAGDRIFVIAHAEGLKGVTTGLSRISIGKASGVATIGFFDDNEIAIDNYLSDMDPSNLYSLNLTGVVEVTASGTLVLDLLLLSSGSDSSYPIGDVKIQAFFLKNQS